MKYTAKTIEDTQKIAEEFVKTLIPFSTGARVIGLYGELGAGKTSFTQGVAKTLRVVDNVASPTFVIEKIYELPTPKGIDPYEKFTHLIHIDAYRIEKSEELLHLGWQEVIANPQNLILIEWPERVSDIMPLHTRIDFTHIPNQGREIEIT